MEGKRFLRRLIFIVTLLACLLAVFTWVLYNLQVVNAAYYRGMSSLKITNQETVEAARGEILDRYGRVLVTNRAAYQVTLDTSMMGEEAKRNANLLELIAICREQGQSWTDTLPISQTAPFTFTTSTPYTYTVKSRESITESALSRLLKGEQLQNQGFLPLETGAPLSAPSSGEDEEQIIVTSLSRLLDALPLQRQGYLPVGETRPEASQLIQALRGYFQIDETVSDRDARALIGVLYELNLRQKEISYSDYIFTQDVDIDFISAVKERGLTGVRIQTATVREYETTYAPHLLGRVGPIYREDWDYYKSVEDYQYNMNDTVGKDGVELAFEKYLRGTSGVRVLEQNTSGKVVGEAWETEPQPGDNVVLTLDIRLQEALERSMAQRIPELPSEETEGGAAVITDMTGAVLAMASYPGYDLTTIYTSNTLYAQVASDPLTPFVNRAISTPYSPGSTFKPVVAIAALEEGLVTTTETIRDTGYLILPEEEKYPYGDYHPMCWYYREYGANHGLENVTDALRDSCNIYFYTIGHRLGIDLLDHYAALFGLGQTTGFELAGEASGWVAGPATSASLGNTWYGGELLAASIGQSNNACTPLQLANYIATLVNGGHHYSTHILQSVKSSDYSATVYDREPELLNVLEMDQENLEAVKLGMWKVANGSGTAAKYFTGLPVEVGAKTGTSQTGTTQSDAVFVCFAPYDDPEIAMAIVVEKGGSGTELAAIAADVLAYYFNAEGTMESVDAENTLLH